jgi:hypothetical protein
MKCSVCGKPARTMRPGRPAYCSPRCALRGSVTGAVERGEAEPITEVPFVDTCLETAYGTTVRLPFQVRVF